MASCFSFPRCCFRKSRNEGSADIEAGCNGGGGAPADMASKRDSRFRQRWLSRKRADIPYQMESTGKQQESVLMHWAPQSRAHAEVMHEIELGAPANSATSLEKESADPQRERNFMTRLRELLTRVKTQEQQEIEALRKEKKEIKKALKSYGLYNRRMAFDHMRELKIVVEQSLECEKKKALLEIEMKEMKSSPKIPSAPIDIPKPVPTDDSSSVLTHSGSGKPISNPIDIPNAIRAAPKTCINLPTKLIETVANSPSSSSIASTESAPNVAVVVVQADVHPDPEKTEPALEAVACAVTVDLSNSNRKRKEVDQQLPPSLPEKKSKVPPRVVGFVVKPKQSEREVDAIVVDSTFSCCKEEQATVAVEQGQAVTIEGIPNCLQDFRWTFDQPHGRERYVE